MGRVASVSLQGKAVTRKGGRRSHGRWAEQQCQSTRVAGAHALPRRCRLVNQACTGVRADATDMAKGREVDCEWRVGRR